MPGSDVTDAAYRCFSGNGIYDPCWADTSDPYGQTVDCLLQLWSTAIVRIHHLNNTPDPLPASAPASFPLGLLLSDGEHCQAAEGAHGEFNGRVVEYGCDRLAVLRGLDQSGPVWKAQTVTFDNAGHYSRGPQLTVRTAWLPDPSVSAVATAQPGTATVTGTDIAIRHAPSRSAQVLGRLQHGETIHFDCVTRGEAVADPQTGQPDNIWILLADQPGVVSDAFVYPHQALAPGADPNTC